MSAPEHIKEQLKDKLAALPDRPGCYLFKNASGKIIYIGKAKSLKNRVRTYFNSGDDGRMQYEQLVNAIRDFEIILTRDEVEALTTEANLIKLHRPRYNVELRDDRSLPFLQITDEEYPRVLLTRKPYLQKGTCYGPYTDVRATRYLLRNLSGILHIRNCALPLTTEKIAQKKFKLCLDYHIGRCGGPCEGKVARDEYLKGLERFVQFLKGQHDNIISDLEQEMVQYSKTLQFEKAAIARDKLRASRQFSDRQVKVEQIAINRDIIGIAREDSYAAFSVVRVRSGRIVGQSPFHMDKAYGLTNPELLEAFVVKHYDIADSLPTELFLPFEPVDLTTLQRYMQLRTDNAIHIIVPKRGDKRKLLDLADVNAQQLLLEQRLMADKRDFVTRSVKALQEQLNLDNPPILIEAFDISNLLGTDSVASMVSFRNGTAWKNGYRIFKIKQVQGIDDFASIGEAVRRRYTRVKQEIESTKNIDDIPDSKRPQLPDLILIDGGKGQLGSAVNALNELNLTDIPIIGLAKRLEEIYFPGYSEPMTLSRQSSALRLLQQIRDEAHRFAITRHRGLRHRRQVKSKLDNIAGIGPARKQALLKKFGSIKRISEAELSEITAIPGIPKHLAEELKKELST